MVNKTYRTPICILVFVAVIQLSFFLPRADASASAPFKVSANAAVLIDALSGKVIFGQNPQERISPASLVKLMTLYLAHDALKAGVVKPDDAVIISEKAWATQGSKMFVEVGKTVSFEKLLEGIASISGNDACVAVAEHLAGLEDTFTVKMNEKAHALGMVNSHFKNANGLPENDQYTTAMDIGLLSYHYLKDHPEALKLHSIKEFSFGGITQHNRNKLLWLNEGVDGLKTGWIDDHEGFHLIATAKRNDQRFIAIVMGAQNPRTRENEALKLLNYGFKNFSTVELFKAGESIATIDVWKGKSAQVSLTTDGPIVLTLPMGEEKNLSVTKTFPKRIFAPVPKGKKIGGLEITLKGELLNKIDLIAQDEVPQAHLIKRLSHTVFLSFILKPYWGWIVLPLVLLSLCIFIMIIRKPVKSNPLSHL